MLSIFIGGGHDHRLSKDLKEVFRINFLITNGLWQLFLMINVKKIQSFYIQE